MMNLADVSFTVASMHSKWVAIAPLLERELGMRFLREVPVNSDSLGTFSGEVERTMEPFDAAREKCKMALKIVDSSVVIATEGSFFPHPNIPFAYVHSELILFYYPAQNFEFHYIHHTTKTNFGGGKFTDLKAALEFGHEKNYPLHGVVVKSNKDEWKYIQKDCNTWTELKDAIAECVDLHGQVYLETDMRAMRNPTRQREIAEATSGLVKLLRNACPNCHQIGFGLEKGLAGLECELCFAPTRLEKARFRFCRYCNFAEPVETDTPKEKASAQFCDSCNP